VALVEFAIVMPLLFALLLGTVSAGFALAAKNSMTNAVREGARLGATLPKGGSWDTDWAIAVRDRVVGLSGGDLDNGQVCVQMVKKTSTGDTVLGRTPTTCPFGPIPSTPSSTPVDSCLVKVWAERTASIQAVIFSMPLNLESKAIGRYERTPCA
jgi:Flp pilus assembly protein TadG